MFGSWNKSTPTCGDKRKRSDSISSINTEVGTLEGLKLTRKTLMAPKNSSGLRPQLAILHNQAEKSSVTANLLSLPTSVLIKICRYTVVGDKEIVVSAEDPWQCSELALLKTCRYIRNIARPIFYRENDFEFLVDGFDVKVLLPWRDMCNTLIQAWPPINHSGPRALLIKDKYNEAADMSEEELPEKKLDMITWQVMDWLDQEVSEESVVGNHFWSVRYDPPNWENLVNWLELWHGNEIGRYNPEVDGGADQAALASLFDLVERYRGQSWEFVLTTLPSIRGLLSATDERWSH